MITQENIPYTADEIKAMVKTCEKYNKALERASKLKVQNPFDTVGQMVEHIFPELEESEDERIRKAIKKALQVRCGGSRIISDEPVTLEEALAWLEKQNKQSYLNIPSRETILAIWELGNDWKELTNGSISTEYGTQLDFIQKHWHESEYYLKEKQGKQTQLDYEHADILQKDFAPIEPKFKVGDWVINNVCFPRQIASIKDGMYTFTKGDAMSILFIDGNFHLWTIQDAKDGDVLINWNNTTFIFKAIEDETVKYHVAYNEKWDTIKTPSTKLSHLGLPEPKFEFHPATKEQRNLLFQKMKEARYEWDAQKKEVKKIEPNFKVGDKVTMKGDKTVYTIGIVAPDKTCWLKHGSYEYGWATFGVLKHYVE